MEQQSKINLRTKCLIIKKTDNQFLILNSTTTTALQKKRVQYKLHGGYENRY